MKANPPAGQKKRRRKNRLKKSWQHGCGNKRQQERWKRQPILEKVKKRFGKGKTLAFGLHWELSKQHTQMSCEHFSTLRFIALVLVAHCMWVRLLKFPRFHQASLAQWARRPKDTAEPPATNKGARVLFSIQFPVKAKVKQRSWLKSHCLTWRIQRDGDKRWRSLLNWTDIKSWMWVKWLAKCTHFL